MLPGGYEVIACPKCKAAAKYETILSGNTFGTIYWTDGKSVSPMLPVLPSIVECHKCGELFWLEMAEVLGEMTGFGDDDEWQDSPEVREPEELSYYHAIEKGFASTLEEEITLRRLAWWRRNDAFRQGFAADSLKSNALQRQAEENMQRLLSMQDLRKQDDQIFAAELHRELGQFEQAIALLEGIEGDYGLQIREFILSLCRRGIQVVTEFTPA